MPAVLAADTEWGLCVFFRFSCVCYGLLYLRSIYSFPLFYLGDGLIIDGNFQKVVKVKTTNLPAIQMY